MSTKHSITPSLSTESARQPSVGLGSASGGHHSIIFVVVFFSLLLFFHPTFADEGMYPLSEIHKLNLKAKGLKVTPKDIFNPGHVGLMDAIVNIGGCTGSFISNDGLIITNHHCAFGAVQAASTTEHDYVTNGFLAQTRTEEITAKGLTVRIVDSYKDVSKDILGEISDTMDLTIRTKTIDKKIKEIITETEKQNPGKRAEVSEMFTGKSYILFIYTFLKDVRLVYVPPRSIGEFGGENDNWVWPRHTGDFSFIRAYTAPDRSPAEYSKENVPYHPRKYLKVNPNGVDENDPVFILGYPGRTFRHRTSQYISYEEDVRMPYVADLFEWQIQTMETMGKNDRAISLKLDGRIKGLANTMKNYRGKLQGLKRLNIVEKKVDEEKALQSFINADPKRKEKYGNVLEEIGNIYQEIRENADYELTLDYLRQGSNLLSLGYTVFEAAKELKKPDLERESPYMERNFARTKEGMQSTLRNYYEPVDKIFLKEILMRTSKLPQDKRIAAIDEIIKDGNPESMIDEFINNAYQTSKLNDIKFLMNALTKSPEEIDQLNDPFINLAKSLYPSYQQLKETRQRREGALSKLSALLVDVKEQFLKKDFIPDANSTLRLTFGKIKGYSPADALYASPITTVKGVIEKTTGVEPYITPQKLIELYKAKNFGRYLHKKLKDVPVALLYNLDTTGGNSGSPLLNNKGEVVGVNFDRAYEATINDYAWSENYSRSIAVDAISQFNLKKVPSDCFAPLAMTFWIVPIFLQLQCATNVSK
ncbi:MAG: S46 family peptidase [Ignavibacteriales bacterium]|nr:S46 family peptidase [Ignavibacteriales bacterium]